ncbi:MAG: phosphotransferase family protein [Sphingomonadales bacterium]|nr:MAG: phosphotransferase family protein [Sphingomonadales bacterium]
MSILSTLGTDELLRAALEDWLRRQDPKISVQALRSPGDGNGYSNETHVVDLTAAGKARRHILRLPPEHVSLFPRYDLSKQYAFMEALQGRDNVPMARCVGLEPDASVLGRPFFVVDFIEGLVPPDNPTFLEAGWVVDATDEQRKTLWTSTIDAIAALSHVEPSAQLLSQVDWPSNTTPRTLQLLDHYQGLIDWAVETSCPIDFPLLDDLGAYLRESAPPEAEPAIVWGDARPGNIIYRDCLPVALLDWELAYIGNPAEDLAWMLTMQRFYERRLMRAGRSGKRLGGFLGDAETVDYYNARARRPITNWRYYWLLSAYRHLAISQRFAGMMHEFGAYDAEEMMRMRLVPDLFEDVAAVLGDEQHDAFFA